MNPMDKEIGFRHYIFFRKDGVHDARPLSYAELQNLGCKHAKEEPLTWVEIARLFMTIHDLELDLKLERENK